MDLKSQFFKIKLHLIDAKIKLKEAPSSCLRALKEARNKGLRGVLRDFIYAVSSLVSNTSTDISFWNVKSFSGILRYLILSFLVLFLFALFSLNKIFIANDGFISFRYVSNAMAGFGFVFNTPPFEPLSGFTSFLWLLLLKVLWKLGIAPPFSAHLLTFFFSVLSVWIGFFFIKRMHIKQATKDKSLFLFLMFCLFLLLMPSFMGFTSSGTEASLFNFLVLWWTFEATSEKKRNPIFISIPAVLLTMTRMEGVIFIPASLLFLTLFLCQKRGLVKVFLSVLLLGSVWFYFDFLKTTYAGVILHSVSNLYQAHFPLFAFDYLLSFIIEYGLYFWLPILMVWTMFFFVFQKDKKEKGVLNLFFVSAFLFLTFSAYLFYFIIFIGGDALEYKPFGFFLPLSFLLGIKMLGDTIGFQAKFVFIVLFVSLLFSTAIPHLKSAQMKSLETREETRFFYQPISQTTNPFALFKKRYDDFQKNLVYQGVGLRLKEHKVLTDVQTKSFPSREEGARIQRNRNLLFAWHFIGVASWRLPEVIMIDTSGQNNFIAAKAELKFSAPRRLLGQEKNVPQGYIACFNGGSSVQVNPFTAQKNILFPKRAYLSNGKIGVCEDLWRIQVDSSVEKPRSLNKTER